MRSHPRSCGSRHRCPHAAADRRFYSRPADRGWTRTLTDPDTRRTDPEHDEPAAGSPVLVVLAAGRSRRMAGRHKLLRPYPEAPMIRRSVEVALEADVGPVGVVVDPAVPALTRAIRDLPITVLENPHAAEGASTSVRLAAAWAFARADALLLTLADEPDLKSDDILAVIESWRTGLADAIRVRYRDRPGHPVLITRPFYEAAVVEGDRGLGEALERGRAAELPLGHDAPTDIDTEAEYRAALARLAH